MYGRPPQTHHKKAYFATPERPFSTQREIARRSPEFSVWPYTDASTRFLHQISGDNIKPDLILTS